jgi:DNA topoisomerase-1
VLEKDCEDQGATREEGDSRQNKEENKSVALGRSRINYIDPRTMTSWCKRKEVPIEKICATGLRSNYAWSICNEP